VAWNDAVVVIAVVLAVGWALTYVSLRRTFRRTASELRLETERQLNALTSMLKALETRVAELSQPPAMRAATVPVPPLVTKLEATAPAAKAALDQTKVDQTKEEEVTPEMLVVMAAAVTAFLGKRVRIRSAKMLQSPYEIVNPWSQQGRVFVQASHNLRSRG
jgi:methylmalonyl-CoA carboxyltransferase large subunit